VIGVGGRPIASQLGVDMAAPAPCVLELLQDQDSGSFAQNETVSVLVEGPTGLLGIAVDRTGESARVAEASDLSLVAPYERRQRVASQRGLGRVPPSPARVIDAMALAGLRGQAG